MGKLGLYSVSVAGCIYGVGGISSSHPTSPSRKVGCLHVKALHGSSKVLERVKQKKERD